MCIKGTHHAESGWPLSIDGYSVTFLQQDEQTLKTCIKELEDSIKAMTEDASNAARLYVTDEDIAKLPCTANDTVFAVKAPQGTTLEVPDPDEGLASGERRYRQVESIKHPCLCCMNVYALTLLWFQCKLSSQALSQANDKTGVSCSPIM